MIGSSFRRQAFAVCASSNQGSAMRLPVVGTGTLAPLALAERTGVQQLGAPRWCRAPSIAGLTPARDRARMRTNSGR